MNTLQIRNQVQVKFLVLAAILVTFMFTATGHVSAAPKDASNANAQIRACIAGGGEPEVTISVSKSGFRVIVVECKGGLYDGHYCFHFADISSCDTMRDDYQPSDDGDDSLDIAPLPEPTQVPVDGRVDVPVEEVAPIVDEPTATPTEEPIVDPAIDEPVVIDPVVDDGGTAPVETPETGDDGSKEIGPGINVDPGQIEPNVEPVEVVLL